MRRDLAAMRLHQFGGGFLADALTAPADVDFRPKAEELGRHGLAETGAATGHQDFAARKKTICEHGATLPDPFFFIS